MKETRTTRRHFLGVGVTAAAATCTGCSVIGARKADVVADPNNGTMRLSTEESAVLLQGQSNLLVEVKDRKLKILVVRHADGQLFGLDAKCTHMGCNVLYSEKADHVVCPCHGSKFALDGSVIKGPAKRALKRYPVSDENGRIVIAL
jgi:Rieske Fe-S protein